MEIKRKPEPMENLPKLKGEPEDNMGKREYKKVQKVQEKYKTLQMFANFPEKCSHGKMSKTAPDAMMGSRACFSYQLGPCRQNGQNGFSFWRFLCLDFPWLTFCPNNFR